MEGYMSHLNPGNFPKKSPLKLVEPSRLTRSMHRERKKDINSGITFGIVGLDGTKRGWVVNQILMEFSVQLLMFFVCVFVRFCVFPRFLWLNRAQTSLFKRSVPAAQVRQKSGP